MGISVSLITLGDDNISRVIADPPLIWKVLAPGDPEPYREARGLPPEPAPGSPPPTSTGWLGRLLGKKPLPAAPAVDAELPLGEGEGELGSMDKAWHGIHYLLTGTAWAGDPPLNFIVGGGELVGNEDMDYGTARLLRSAEVRALHEALASVDEAILRERFNPAEMMSLDIYPGIWGRDPVGDDALGYCLQHFKLLKAYIAGAAARGLGLVISQS